MSVASPITTLPREPLAATLAMNFGVLSFATVWVPLVCILTWVLAPLGLAFGLFALRRDPRSPVAIAGAALSLVGLLGCLAWVFVFNTAFTVRPAPPGEFGVSYRSWKG